MGFIWTIIIGFIAGLIARWLAPGPNNPSGFILTTLIGIAGAFLATFIGQARALRPGPGRRPHHLGDRRGCPVVHLAPPGRGWNYSGFRQAKLSIAAHSQ